MKTVLVVVVLAACSGTAQSPAQEPVLTNTVPTPPPDAAVDAPVPYIAGVMAKMTVFRDQLCACKDTACAERVTADLTRWAQELARVQREEQNFTADDTRQIAEISEGFARCMARINASGSGSPP